MKVFISGGAGFLGINLIIYLLGKGIKDIVSCLQSKCIITYAENYQITSLFSIFIL